MDTGSSAPGVVDPTGSVPAEGEVGISYYDFGGNGPDLLLAHATGFCAAVLGPIAEALRDRFRCVAFDMRAHGRSGRPADGDLDWHGFAHDVVAVTDHLGLRAPLGFGHSCGGASLLLAEQARPGTFSGLYCYEPVIYPGETPLAPSLEGNPLSASALRRRSGFDSREDALANFRSKAAFHRIRPDVLEAYVDNGFAPAPGGGISLRCLREDEAEVYAHGFAHDAFARLPEVRCPVLFSCGAETDGFGPDFLDLFAARVADSRTVALPGLGHFGPLEDPDALARSVSDSLLG